MVRHTVTLALIVFMLLCTSLAAVAQSFTFSGPEIIQLAKAVVEHARANTDLPSAYRMPTGNQSVVVTAPMAYEIFGRTIMLWKPDAPFPAQVTGVKFDLQPPAANTKLEPRPGQTYIAMLSQDILLGARIVEQINPMIDVITFGGKSQLTAAQYSVALAMMAIEWEKGNGLPGSLAIPAVRSPQNWNDISNPIPVIPPKPPVILQVAVNGIAIPQGNDQLPAILLQPFCGTIRITTFSSGPVARIALTLNGKELITYTQAGTYALNINSARYPDGAYILGITATDDVGESSPTILPLKMQNGRISAFTPAVLQQTTAPTPITED